MPVAYSDIPTQLVRPVIQTLFFKLFEEAPQGNYREISSVIPSNSEYEEYIGLGTGPRMTRWKDERQRVGIGKSWQYKIYNYPYEATIEIPRKLLKYEKYGQVSSKIQELAEEARRYLDESVYTTVHNGGSINGYDEKPLYANDHDIGSGTQDNDFTSLELTKTSLETVMTAMRKFKDDKGRPMDLLPDTLLVSPDLEVKAAELMEATGLLATGITATEKTVPNANGMKGRFRVLSSAYLTSATEWYLAVTKRATKPIILQDLNDLRLDILDDPQSSDYVFDTDNIKAGSSITIGVGPGKWQYIARGSA